MSLSCFGRVRGRVVIIVDPIFVHRGETFNAACHQIQSCRCNAGAGRPIKVALARDLDGEFSVDLENVVETDAI